MVVDDGGCGGGGGGGTGADAPVCLVPRNNLHEALIVAHRRQL